MCMTAIRPRITLQMTTQRLTVFERITLNQIITLCGVDNNTAAQFTKIPLECAKSMLP